MSNSPDRFGMLTRLLHWVIALLIIGLIWLGWWMVDLTYYDKWYNKSLHWHKSFGLLVLGLAIIKIGWQCYSPVPGPAGQLKQWEIISARLMHYILLASMVLVPLTGYFISSSDGKSIEVFDWFAVPALVSKNTELRDIAITIHFYLSYGITFLLIGHIGAALKHQFIDRDGTLARMIWK